MTGTNMPSNPDFDSVKPSIKQSIFTGASPKFTFVMGMVSGIAVVSLVGFVFAAVYSFSGRFPRTQTGQSAIANIPAAAIPNQPSGTPTTVTITLKPNDHIRGSKDAPVTLVEYSDLECPFCKRFHPEMQQLMQEYDGQVKWVYRHFPLSFHANAQKEAEAAECAGKLGGNDKFWEYTDKIFERTNSNGTGFALDSLVPLAKEIGLPESIFKACLDSGEFTAHVQQDLQEGISFGVNGTPTIFVNGQPVEGAVSYEQLKLVVESLLK